METIDFGCQVRCLNRQRLIPGSTHPQLNQCASQFLAKVRKEVMTLSDSSTTNSKMPEIGWMKLKLSERGLRILPSTSSISSASSCASSTTSSSTSTPFTGMRMQKNRKSDEGFESDSDTSIQPHNNSGGSSSGVNSSSSDIEEADEVIRNNKKSMTMNINAGSDSSDSDRESADVLLTVPIRCSLSDILSCQHPPALGRHVVLLTLRSADDSALDILALECSAEEPARILTMLCQKIQASGTTATTSSNHPAPSVAAQSTCAMATNDPGGASGKKQSNQQQQQQPSAVGSNVPVTAKTAAVSIQSWSDRDRDKRTLDAILVDSKHSSTLDIGVGVKTQNIIRKLERQHSEWSLIQRRTHDGLTHLQISKQQKSSSTFVNHTGVAVGGDVGGGGIRSHTNASVQTTTSGAMLNSNNNKSSKKGMPYGGQLARLETSLAITNSHQVQASRSSGIGSVAAGLKRSETTATAMHHKLSKSKSSGSSVASGSSSSQSSCILSLQTPELPMGPSVTGLSPTVVTDASTSTSQSPTPPCVPQSLPPTKTSRWSFGAPFRQQQQRQHSPEASRRNPKSNQRGRSSERKSSKSDSAPQTDKSTAELNGLFVSSSGMLSIKSNNINNSNSKKNFKSSKSLPEILPVQSPAVAPKNKRDPSKTRSFLMKLTSSSRKSPTPPTICAPPSAPSSTLSLGSENSETQQRPQHPLKLQSRGRSLIRLRSSTRLQSPPPPPASQGGGGQTFLIPTKSGQELTRNIYPKEGPITQSSSSQQQQALPVFHLLTGHNNNNNASGRLRYNNGAPTVTAMSNGWAGYCWNEAAAAAALVRHPVPTYPTSMDSNNNQHLHQQQQQQQQQWIYFHPHPVHHPAPPPQPPPTLIKAGDFNKLRLQRSRSQSPGRMRSSQR